MWQISLGHLLFANIVVLWIQWWAKHAHYLVGETDNHQMLTQIVSHYKLKKHYGRKIKGTKKAGSKRTYSNLRAAGTREIFLRWWQPNEFCKMIRKTLVNVWAWEQWQRSCAECLTEGIICTVSEEIIALYLEGSKKKSWCGWSTKNEEKKGAAKDTTENMAEAIPSWALKAMLRPRV